MGFDMAKDYEESLEDDYDDEGGRLYRVIPRLVVLVALGGFGLLAWYAYHSSGGSSVEGEVPLIEAEKSPVRSAPENPGGMEIPHQDKKVFEAVSGETPRQPEKEQIIATPEEPIAPARVANPAPTPSNALRDAFSESSTGGQASPPGAQEPSVTVEQEPGVTIEQGVKVQRGGIPPIAGITAEESQKVVPLPKKAAPAVSAKAASVTVATVKAPEPAVEPEPKPVVAAKPVPVAVPAPKVETVPLQPKVEKASDASATSAKGARVQLAALKSQEEASALWTKIKHAHAGVVGDRTSHIEKADLGAKGTYYRLQVGGFENALDAKAFCAKLTAAKQGCFVVK